MSGKRERKKYDDEFKRHIVELYEAGQKPSELAKTYDIHLTTVSNWIKYSRNSGSFKQNDNQSEEQKLIKQQEKLIREQQMEIDILKKAMVVMLKT